MNVFHIINEILILILITMWYVQVHYCQALASPFKFSATGRLARTTRLIRCHYGWHCAPTPRMRALPKMGLRYQLGAVIRKVRMWCNLKPENLWRNSSCPSFDIMSKYDIICRHVQISEPWACVGRCEHITKCKSKCLNIKIIWMKFNISLVSMSQNVEF